MGQLALRGHYDWSRGIHSPHILIWLCKMFYGTLYSSTLKIQNSCLIFPVILLDIKTHLLVIKIRPNYWLFILTGDNNATIECVGTFESMGTLEQASSSVDTFQSTGTLEQASSSVDTFQPNFKGNIVCFEIKCQLNNYITDKVTFL